MGTVGRHFRYSREALSSSILARIRLLTAWRFSESFPFHRRRAWARSALAQSGAWQMQRRRQTTSAGHRPLCQPTRLPQMHRATGVPLR